MKKLLWSLGTIGAVLVPIVPILACDEPDDEPPIDMPLQGQNPKEEALDVVASRYIKTLGLTDKEVNDIQTNILDIWDQKSFPSFDLIDRLIQYKHFVISEDKDFKMLFGEKLNTNAQEVLDKFMPGVKNAFAKNNLIIEDGKATSGLLSISFKANATNKELGIVANEFVNITFEVNGKVIDTKIKGILQTTLDENVMALLNAYIK